MKIGNSMQEMLLQKIYQKRAFNWKSTVPYLFAHFLKRDVLIIYLFCFRPITCVRFRVSWRQWVCTTLSANSIQLNYKRNFRRELTYNEYLIWQKFGRQICLNFALRSGTFDKIDFICLSIFWQNVLLRNCYCLATQRRKENYNTLTWLPNEAVTLGLS